MALETRWTHFASENVGTSGVLLPLSRAQQFDALRSRKGRGAQDVTVHAEAERRLHERRPVGVAHPPVGESAQPK